MIKIIMVLSVRTGAPLHKRVPKDYFNHAGFNDLLSD